MTAPPSGQESCSGCPSFLDVDEVAGFFRKSVGAPMCATFGHVLGKPGLKPVGQKAILTEFGKNCEKHGQPRPSMPPERPSMQVAAGDPEVIIAGHSTTEEQQAVSSCLGCVNFVPDRAVMPDLGWPAALCAATGRLIQADRVSKEAKVCDWRKPGPNRSSTAGIILKPIYEDAFGLSADPMTLFLKNRGKPVTDPQDYVSDKDVSEHDAAEGIRAWRKISDPNGTGNFTYLPIYDREHFDPTEQAKIPMIGDEEQPENYVDHLGAVYKAAVLMQELDETPALWGQAGTGKTEFARHLAWLMGLPFVRISITESSDVDDLIGTMRYTEGTGTHFNYGRLVTAWMKPCVLLLDEPNTGPDAVWQAIRPLTDNSKQMVIDQNNGERIPRNLSCYFLMALNPAWDVRNIGARPLADADGNRLMHLTFTLPPEPIERAILEDRCSTDGYEISKDVLDPIMKIAGEIRTLSDGGTLPISWGIRPQVKVARASKWFDLTTAYQIAVANFLDPEQAQVVMQIVRDHVEDNTTAF